MLHRLKDIRYWLLLFFVIRLIGITNPPVETSHNWRQSLTCMIARNLVEVEADIRYPRTDMTEGESGIMGTEFPVFSYLIYGVSKVFGYQHWYGRLINLVISTLGIFFFYKVVHDYLDSDIAFPAAMMLLFSAWFMFSRKIMPDTFSTSLVLMALFYGLKYWKSGTLKAFMGLVLLGSLGVLSKIPTVIILSPLALFLLDWSLDNGRRFRLALGLGIPILMAGIWYMWWMPELVQTYHNPLYFPRTLEEGFREVFSQYADQTFKQFYFSAFFSYLAFGAFLLGLGMIIGRRKERLSWILGISSFGFLLFMLKAGMVFSTCDYYIIPFVPIMAIVAGYGLSVIRNKKLFALALALICIESVANQQHDFFISSKQKQLTQLASLVKEHCPKQGLIATNGGDLRPTQLYFAHRKGWTMDGHKLENPVFLADIQKKGCNCLVLDKEEVLPKLSLKPTYEDERFVIYSGQ